MRKVAVPVLLVLLIGLVAALAFCLDKIHRLQIEKSDALRSASKNYDIQIAHVARWLAERQNEIGHATYLVKGIEKEGRTVLGYPVCNLGCVVAEINGVDVESRFVDAYNARLKQIVEQANKQSLTQQLSR
jgi:hypothetical protein